MIDKNVQPVPSRREKSSAAQKPIPLRTLNRSFDLKAACTDSAKAQQQLSLTKNAVVCGYTRPAGTAVVPGT